MGSGLWGGEHVHIAIHIVIHTSICPSKQFLVDFIAYKLFKLRGSEITRLLSFLCVYLFFVNFGFFFSIKALACMLKKSNFSNNMSF